MLRPVSPRPRSALAAALLALLLAAVPAQAQIDPSSDQLASQARHWEDKGRYDLARESWLKLLRASPDNPAALSGLAMAEARSGRSAAAQVYLDRLREAHPGHPEIRKIEDAIRSGAYDPDRLEGPRSLAREGRYDDAVAAYKQIFGEQVPDGRLGLEYWQTLAGTKDGWAAAREGIAGLAQAHPDEPVYQLALAQHLTYREQTRRDGIAALARLADNRAVAAPAQQAWRQALLWLGAKPGDERLYQAYLSRDPNDSQIAGRLEAMRANRAPAAVAGGSGDQAPRELTAAQLRAQQIREAYDRLNASELAQAATLFEQLVARYPDSDDALGGLGIVRLRQERYGEARTLLQQATARAPRRASRWSEALSTAAFWEQVRAAQAAREQGNPAQAESLLRSALASQPAIAAKEPSVKITLADVLAENGEVEEAERLYREVLARDPRNVGATRGLVGVLVRRNQLPEALNLAESLPPEQKQELGNLGSLKGQYLRDQAKLATDAQDDAQAEQLLRQALLEDPESPWTRLDLSRIYQRQKRTREANTLIDGLLTGGRQMPEAVYIKALLLAEQQSWLEGLQVLELVPYESRTQPMADLQRRLWVRYQTERAGVYSRYGRPQEAMQILQQVEPYATDSPELLGAMAGALAELGQDAPALDFMRQALSRQATPDPGLRLQYASLLFKLRQDAEFEVVMEDLVKYPAWEAQQSVDLANLRIAYRLRQADLVREDGNLARAYEYLEPLLRVNPNDPRLVMALARLYNDAQEYDRALELYRRALQTDPNNLDAYKGAIGASLALNQPEQADGLLEQAFRLDPQNPRLYALAGRAARARGEDGRALQLFQQALLLDQQQGAGQGGESEFGDGRYTPQLYLLDPATSPVNAPFYGYDYGPALSPPAAPVRVSESPPPAAKKKSRASPAGPSADRLRPAAQQPFAASPAALAAVAARAGAALRPAALSRGDRALTRWQRGWRPGRLIKVSTPPETDPAKRYPPPRATAGSHSVSSTTTTITTGGAGWVQDAPDRYSYSPQTGSLSVPYGPAPAAAAPATRANSLPAYTPRQLAPSTQLTVPRPRRPYPSLREEVLRDIGEITGQPPAAAPPPQTLPPGSYPLHAPPPAARPAPRAPRSGYPAAGTLPYSSSTTTITTGVPAPRYPTSLPLGATVEEYERQGLRVLPGQPGYSTSTTTRSTGRAVGSTGSTTTTTGGLPAYVPPPAAPYAPYYPQTAPAAGRPAGGLELRADPVLRTPDFVLQRRRVQADQPNEVLREIADINARRTPYIGAGLSVRSRDGQAGLDRLTDLEVPVEFSVAGAQAGRFRLRAVPVFLDAGTVSGRQLPLFGAMALVEGDDFRFDQNTSGVAVGAAYGIGDLRLDFGSSPLGFPVETLVGGMNWQPKMDRVSFKLDLSRRSVTDSLLSYAGTRDPATGLVWGGVTKNGGRLDLAYDHGQYGVYANGSYHVLDGENVARNSVYELGGGFYARALDRRDMRVTWGINLTSFFYDKNLRRFTFGHGGYFSPQSYFAVAVPVEWAGGRDRFSYKLNAALGIQSFREDGSALFPNNSDLQAAVEGFVEDEPDSEVQAGYSSQSSTGIGFNFGGLFEYLVAPNIVVGARFGVDNARDYEEAHALGYMRYSFSGQRSVSNPPAPLLPYYDFGDPTL